MYKEKLENPYKLEDDELEIYFDIDLHVQKRNQNVTKVLDDLVRTILCMNDHKLNIDYKYDRTNGIANIQFILREKKKTFGLDDFEIPDALKDSLRLVEQGFKAQMAFGFPLRDFVNGGKMLDLLFKGFRYDSEIAFLKKLKKVLVEAFKNDNEDAADSDTFINKLKMIGPLFSINSDIKIDFSHTDLKEILEHEHLQKGNLKYDDLLMMLSRQEDLNEVKTQDFELEGLGMSEEKLIKSGIEMYTKDAPGYYHQYFLNNAIIQLFELSAEDFTLNIRGVVGGFFSFDANVRGQGFGAFAAQFVRAASYKERKHQRENIHKDFLIANKLLNKHKDLYGEVPKY